MKKIIFAFFIAVMFSPLIASAEENEIFINKFDVEISADDYIVLRNLGYPDESINNITQTYFDYIMENKDTLVIQSIRRDNQIVPFSMDDYPREGLYQDFHVYGNREQITSINSSEHNGNNVYEVVNFVSWLNVPAVRSVDLNMISFDDFYVTPIRSTLDGEQAVSYTTCPNGDREPDEIVHYSPYGTRVIYGAETVGFGMNLVNDYEGQGKCVDGIASMIKVKLDNTRSDVNSFYVTGSYLHLGNYITESEIATALAKAALTRSVRKGVISLAQSLLEFRYDTGNRTGFTVDNPNWG